MRFARSLLAAAALVLAAPAGAQPAKGGGADVRYPVRPVRWVVPFPPGASNDIIARLVAAKLTEAWGEQFVIDNRSGAGGAIGAETVARASPDGYTLLLANPGPSLNNPLLRRDSTFKVESFTQVVFIGYTPLILAAFPAFVPNGARELVDYARANPDKVRWGSAGFGSSLHIGFELFRAATGVKVIHVPYKGTAPALTELVGGQIDLMHTTSVSAEQHIRSKRLKVLASAGLRRQAVLPDVPTLAEQGIKGAEAIVWFGMSAPAATPRAIVDKLNAQVNRALSLPDVKQRLDQLGLEVMGGSSADFTKFVADEAAKLRGLVKSGAVEPQ